MNAAYRPVLCLATLAACLVQIVATARADMMKDSPVTFPAKVHPHIFCRGRVHANEFGEQILSKILMEFFRP